MGRIASVRPTDQPSPRSGCRRASAGCAGIDLSFDLHAVAALAIAGLASAAWASAQKIDEMGGNNTEVNTPSLDGCPIQSPDGLSLYLASNRPGGKGGLDVWMATRKMSLLCLVPRRAAAIRTAPAEARRGCNAAATILQHGWRNVGGMPLPMTNTTGPAARNARRALAPTALVGARSTGRSAASGTRRGARP